MAAWAYLPMGQALPPCPMCGQAGACRTHGLDRVLRSNRTGRVIRCHACDGSLHVIVHYDAATAGKVVGLYRNWGKPW